MTANNMIATRVQDQPLRNKVITDSGAPGLLAKRPMIGFIMFIFGGLLFSGLAFNLVAKGPLLQWDRAIANTLPTIALKTPVFFKSIMDAGYYIGDQVIMGLSILIGIYLILK